MRSRFMEFYVLISSILILVLLVYCYSLDVKCDKQKKEVEFLRKTLTEVVLVQIKTRECMEGIVEVIKGIQE